MDYHYENTLTTRDCKRHIPHRFPVPEGSGQLDIEFHFEPRQAHGIANLLALTVFDPHGFRGSGHRDGNSDRVRIGPAGATPGYLPGPLPPGEWTVEVHTHMVMPGEPVRYRLEITAGGRSESDLAPVAPPAAGSWARERGPGWYRGDLHTHTHHSDAPCLSVAGLAQMAREHRLDFLFLTDHNTTAGLAEIDALATEDLCTAGGIELTTFWGHALCLGRREWVDWRISPGSGEMARIATETYANGQVFVIAHPASPGDPWCTGCNWRFGEMMPGPARLIEIWNGPWGGDSNNEPALALWYDWLNQGLRLAATAGTDAHNLEWYDNRPGFSVVYAEELSEKGLLDALRAGRLYLSAGPQLELQARDVRGQTYIVGETAIGPATFTVRWTGCPAGARLRLMANGRLLDERPAGPEGEYEWPMTPGEADWIVVEIRAGDGEMLAITNPIFLKERL